MAKKNTQGDSIAKWLAEEYHIIEGMLDDDSMASINSELNILLIKEIDIRKEILAATKKLQKLTEELCKVERERIKYMNIGIPRLP